MTKRFLIVAAACSAVMATPANAFANPPVLSTVGVQNRHPAATLAAPRSDQVTIYIANQPHRATDGSFLTETVKMLDILTTDEIQAGRWSSEDQLDPGTYWAMLRASPYFAACWIWDAAAYDPSCANGYSNVVPFTVARPAIRYTGRATVYRYSQQVSLELTASPLGDTVPYRVCTRTTARRNRCVTADVNGYSWNSSASDTVTMTTRGLPAIAPFTWFVNGAKVATRRARVR